MLSIPRTILQQIQSGCLDRRPEEACGLLFGQNNWIHEAVLVDNVWPNAAERTTRYAIDPLAQLKIERQGMAKGLELIGFFHSHPRGPAAPSQFDTDRAWPGYVYLILGLEAPVDARVRAWVLDESGRFGEHPVRTID